MTDTGTPFAFSDGYPQEDHEAHLKLMEHLKKQADEIVQYIIVRTDIPMSPGKLAAQVGHGVQLAIRKAEVRTVIDNSNDLRDWEAGDYAKVVLGGDKRDFERLCKLASESVELANSMVRVVDNGRTEIPAGTFTCLAFVPMPKSVAKKWVGRLRLYK